MSCDHYIIMFVRVLHSLDTPVLYLQHLWVPFSVVSYVSSVSSGPALCAFLACYGFTTFPFHSTQLYIRLNSPNTPLTCIFSFHAHIPAFLSFSLICLLSLAGTLFVTIGRLVIQFFPIFLASHLRLKSFQQLCKFQDFHQVTRVDHPNWGDTCVLTQKDLRRNFLILETPRGILKFPFFGTAQLWHNQCARTNLSSIQRHILAHSAVFRILNNTCVNSSQTQAILTVIDSFLAVRRTLRRSIKLVFN